MVSHTRSGHLQSFLPKRFTTPEQGASLNAERLPRSPVRSGRHQSGCHASSVIHESTSFVPTCWGKGRRAAREDALAQPVPHPRNVLRPPPSRFQWAPWVPLGAGPAPAQIPQRGGDGGDVDGEGNAVQSQVDSVAHRVRQMMDTVCHLHGGPEAVQSRRLSWSRRRAGG